MTPRWVVLPRRQFGVSMRLSCPSPHPVLALAVTGGSELVLVIADELTSSVSDVSFLSPLLRHVREDSMSPVHIVRCIRSLA